MDYSKNNNNHNLGVNKIGKIIRKSPLRQTIFNNNNQPPQSQQPQVYNISKTDFRSIVQQLTGSPSRSVSAPPRPPPPHNPPKPPSVRLHKIRPPPLSPVARPPPLRPFPPTQADAIRSNTAESPVSVYMRYLETSFLNSGGGGQQPQQPHQPGILPTPPGGGLPSPGGFFNLMSPLSSPYRVMSPRFQFPPPLTPSFFGGLSPMSQAGILGPGPGFGHQQQPPPLSPGLLFSPPMSPSGFLPIRSPRWRG
ncbi:hypothetical protein QJS10_CPB11g00130 [Acorus calamus]|uniref:VQ domain-containing protein n=1 Tax=Acorus calamus TaxID=4465 RepID=A0AAV9DQ35_ACOCL|nr:hypothetical protein QJS10_CPB11g00130 [Acorus calamus]